MSLRVDPFDGQDKIHIVCILKTLFWRCVAKLKGDDRVLNRNSRTFGPKDWNHLCLNPGFILLGHGFVCNIQEKIVYHREKNALVQ